MLRLVIDRIAERFAMDYGASHSRREVRDRTDDLVLELLAALRSASLAEIVATTDTLERRRKARATSSRVAERRGSDGASQRTARTFNDTAHQPVPPAPRDPFDITKPSELLDPAITGTELQVFSADSSRQLGFDSLADEGHATVDKSLAGSNGMAAPSDGISSQEDHNPFPKVALRDGEQLVRSGGSGVVIRRARGA